MMMSLVGADTELPVPPTYPEPRHATIKDFVKSVRKIMAGRNGIVTYQTGWKGYNSWHMCVWSPLPLPTTTIRHFTHTYLLLPWKLLPYHHQCLPTQGLCSPLHRLQLRATFQKPAPICQYSGLIWLDVTQAKRYISWMGANGKTNSQVWEWW